MFKKLQNGLFILAFFGLAICHWIVIVGPTHRWAILHSVFTSAEIREQGILVVGLSRPHSAAFSNGIRCDYGVGPEILVAVVWIATALPGFYLLARVTQLVLPAAYTTFFRSQTKPGRGESDSQAISTR